MIFRDFKTEDFLQHPVFRQWVLEQDPEATRFWEQWLQENPDRQQQVTLARELLLLIGGGAAHAPAPQDEQNTWNKVLQSISIANQHTPARARLVKMNEAFQSGPRRRWPYAAALVAGLLLACAAVFFFRGNNTVRYATVMGEMKTIELPDHSIVKLNVNSTLQFAKKWAGTGPREVWLKGEAFFTVQHKYNNQRFIVHTNDVNIQVVGTEFNVNTRRVKTQVVLRNGVVKLTLNNNKTGRNATQPITMKPGDMVTYSAATKELINKRVNPEEYASWRTPVLLFNETPVAEVIRSLQDNLGLTIQLEDDSLGMQTFTGSIPRDNIEVFFRTLGRSLNVHIEKTGVNTYSISKIQGE